ncbi:MAG: MerR family transcriptional regulator [Alphaproteobacteria bacterium]
MPDKSTAGKSSEAFRTISEVAADLDVPQHVLRFWETKFSQVRPLKRGGGRRYYRPEDVALLRRIRHLLYADGFTIKGVQKILRGRSGGPAGASTGDDAAGVAAASADSAGPAGPAAGDPSSDGPGSAAGGAAAASSTLASASPAAAVPAAGLRRELEIVRRELERVRSLLAGVRRKPD